MSLAPGISYTILPEFAGHNTDFVTTNLKGFLINMYYVPRISKKRLFDFSLAALGQIVVFYLVYLLWWTIRVKYMGPSRGGVGYGILVYYGFWLFCILSIINSAFLVSSISAKFKNGITAICLAILGVYLLPSAPHIPYRAGMLFLIGGVSLFMPMLVLRRHLTRRST